MAKARLWFMSRLQFTEFPTVKVAVYYVLSVVLIAKKTTTKQQKRFLWGGTVLIM